MTETQTNTELLADSAAWKVRILDDIGDVTDTGEAVLDLAVDAYVRLRIAQRELLRDGPTITDRFKQKRPHPATAAAQQAESSIVRLLEKVVGDGDPKRFLTELR